MQDGAAISATAEFLITSTHGVAETLLDV